MIPSTHSFVGSTARLLGYSRVLTLIFCSLVVTGHSLGQATHQYTTNRVDQVLRGTSRVNPSTLGLQIDIPISSYPGRGINLPVNLSYSSKVWRLKSVNSVQNSPLLGGCVGQYHPYYSERSAGGWSNSIEFPYVEYTGRDEQFNEHGHPAEVPIEDCGEDTTYYKYIKRLVIHLPGGESHEMRASDTAVSYPTFSNCPGSPCYSNQASVQANWDTTFYATDGSNLRYVEDSTTGTYELLMPDGSHYDFASTFGSMPVGGGSISVRYGSTYTDRNGNSISYHFADSTHTSPYVIDTLGRTILLPFSYGAPTSAQDKTYYVPGFAGGNVEYHLIWKQLKGSSAGTSALTNYSDSLKDAGCDYRPVQTWFTTSAGLFCGNDTDKILKNSSDFNPVVLTEIQLPNGTSYKFTYNIYGLLERIYYPTGGDERVAYSQVAPIAEAPPNNVTDQTNFGITNRKVYATADTGTPDEWNYSITKNDEGGYKVQIENPDGTKSQQFLHRGNPACAGTGCTSSWGYDNALAGYPYEERSFDSNGHLVARKLTHWSVTSFTAVDQGIPQMHPRVDHEENYTYDTSGNGVYTTKIYEYENSMANRSDQVLVSKVTEWDYQTTSGGSSITPSATPAVTPSPVPSPVPSASPARSTETTYMIDDSAYSSVVSNYTAQNMYGLPTISKVKDSAGTVVSQSQIVYDESGSSPGYRGNPTTSKAWDSTKGVVTNSSAYIATHAAFDGYGNQTSTTDANGNTTSTTFDSLYHAFPVTVTSAVPDSTGTYGSSTALTTTNTYDLPITGAAYSGLLLTTTDPNELKTEITYDSDTLRPTDVKKYDGSTQVGGTVQTVYHDETGNFWIESRSQLNSTDWAESYQYFDGLGRVVRTRKVDAGGDDYTLTCYDSMSRVSKTTNPFRSYSTQTCSTTSGLDWTINTFDVAGRPWKVTTPDTAYVETTYGVATSGSAVGTTVTVTDQAGKVRRSVTNGLGQLVRVDEPNSSNQLDVSGSVYQPTSYTYDTLNNLTGVQQNGSSITQCGGSSSCTQSRSFSYSSLSRLTSATNPESGTVTYGYDDNGNLTSKTDARAITTSYTYDHLNRVKQRSYTDGTPTVSYYYDNLTNGGGKLKKVTSSVSTTEYTGYDILGRVTAHKQTTGGNDYTTAYTYDLAGNLLEETYPSGRVVKNTVGADGTLSQVETKPSGGSYATRATGFTYTAAGAVSALTLGNGLYESTSFNNRLQPTDVNLGTSSGGTQKLGIHYSYETTGNHDDNGNVRSQTISVPGLSYSLNQSYTYDELNRIASAAETYNGSQNWKQEFSYDRYGNRNFVTGTGHTTTLGGCTTMCNPTFSSTTNRITSTGYSFDSAGNMTGDPSGRTFTYDAENKQTEVDEPTGGAMPLIPQVYRYYYDGDGRRVKKSVPGLSDYLVTAFIYDAFGHLVEEYTYNEGNAESEGRSAGGPSAPATVFTGPTLQTSYVYAGSRLLTTEDGDGTHYLTADHLGSPRINTDASGNVTARHDYMPFGEEIATTQRTSGVGYAGDSVRKQFTGYERDGETGLDFAQARTYTNLAGRFTVPDPEGVGADEREPQTWNGYSYVVNSPTNLTDANGLTYLRHGDNIYWVDDAAWENCQRKKSKCQEQWKDYHVVPYGTVITVSPDEKGEFYAYAGQRVRLDRGRQLTPITTTEPDHDSTMAALFNGFERRAMWFWRPVIYGVGTAEMAGLSAATAVGAGAGGGPITELGVGNGSIRFLSQTFISRVPSQNVLMGRLFNSGQIPTGLTKRAVEAYIEITKFYLMNDTLKPSPINTQLERLRILEDAVKKMSYP